MLEKAINRILSLADVKTLSFGGRDYTTAALQPVKEPTLPLLEVNTLKGLVDYLKSGLDLKEIGNYVNVIDGGEVPEDYLRVALHIVSPLQVLAFLPVEGPWKKRVPVVQATWNRRTFPFDDFLSQENFVIKLLATVQEGADTDLEKVLEFAGKIVCEDKAEITDNGVSQAVTVQRGVRQESGRVLPLRPSLKPVRTFTEVEQPVSTFVFRMRSEPVALALFEADMGAWEMVAKENIKKYLETELPGVPVFM